MTRSCDPALPAGSCKHRPYSNGWSGQRLMAGESRSYCGYCQAVVLHDDEWIAKFRARGAA